MLKSLASDSGSNFIGGESELRALAEELDDNKRITQHLIIC